MQNTFEIFVTEDTYLFLRHVKAERVFFEENGAFACCFGQGNIPLITDGTFVRVTALIWRKAFMGVASPLSQIRGTYMQFISPYTYYAALGCVRGKARNFPLVRRKLSFHVNSVMINNSGRSVDDIRWFVKEDILSLLVCPLRQRVWLIRNAPCYLHVTFATTSA